MIVLLIYYFWLHFHAGKCQLLQCIFQTENADKALKYRLYRHLPAYEKIIRNLVSFYRKIFSKGIRGFTPFNVSGTPIVNPKSGTVNSGKDKCLATVSKSFRMPPI